MEVPFKSYPLTLKNLTVNLSHLASGFAGHGTVIHLEKSWHSHSQIIDVHFYNFVHNRSFPDILPIFNLFRTFWKIAFLDLSFLECTAAISFPFSKSWLRIRENDVISQKYHTGWVNCMKRRAMCQPYQAGSPVSRGTVSLCKQALTFVHFFYTNCYSNFNSSGIFDKITSLSQILNQFLDD